MAANSSSRLYDLYLELGNAFASHSRNYEAADAYALALYYAKQMGDSERVQLCRGKVAEQNPTHVAAKETSAPLLFAQLLMRYPANEAEESLAELKGTLGSTGHLVMASSIAPSSVPSAYSLAPKGLETTWTDPWDVAGTKNSAKPATDPLDFLGAVSLASTQGPQPSVVPTLNAATPTTPSIPVAPPVVAPVAPKPVMASTESLPPQVAATTAPAPMPAPAPTAPAAATTATIDLNRIAPSSMSLSQTPPPRGREALPSAPHPLEARDSNPPPAVESHHVFDLGSSMPSHRALSMRAAEDFLLKATAFPEMQPSPAPHPVNGLLNFAACITMLCSVSALGFFGSQLYPILKKIDVEVVLSRMTSEPTAPSQDATTTPPPVTIQISSDPKTPVSSEPTPSVGGPGNPVDGLPPPPALPRGMNDGSTLNLGENRTNPAR